MTDELRREIREAIRIRHGMYMADLLRRCLEAIDELETSHDGREDSIRLDQGNEDS